MTSRKSLFTLLRISRIPPRNFSFVNKFWTSFFASMVQKTCLSLCIYNNIIIKQPNSIHSSPFGARIDCKGYPPGSFCSLEWSRDGTVFLAKSLIFIHYSKSNHCLTKLSLRYPSLNPTNQSMSLNIDCHDMSSDRDFCYEYMYRHYNTFHVLFKISYGN